LTVASVSTFSLSGASFWRIVRVVERHEFMLSAEPKDCQYHFMAAIRGNESYRMYSNTSLPSTDHRYAL
jgi:hypothetical protein